MEQRIISKEHDGHWHIKMQSLEAVSPKELEDLVEYFLEIQLNYSKSGGVICVNGAIPLTDVIERIEFFYDGVADVTTC